MSRKQNQVIVDFIELNRSEPCLWQVKSADYHDRAKKDAAYNKLAKKLEELEPGATKQTVLAKINSLRSAFRKERKKVEATKKSGTSADSIYKPVLWYYDLFDFLHDQDTPRASTSNLDSESEEESTDTPRPVEQAVNDDVDGATSATENVPAKQQRPPLSRPGLNKKIKLNDELSTEVLTTVRDHFKAPREQSDRYDLLGKTVAVRLRSLGKRQALIAEKKILDVLFETEMDSLMPSPMDHYSLSGRQLPNTTQTPSTVIGASFRETQNNRSGQSLYSHNSASSYINNCTPSTAPSPSRETPSSLTAIHYYSENNSAPSYLNNMSPSPTLSESHYSQNSSTSSYVSSFRDV